MHRSLNAYEASEVKTLMRYELPWIILMGSNFIVHSYSQDF